MVTNIAIRNWTGALKSNRVFAVDLILCRQRLRLTIHLVDHHRICKRFSDL
jgi:hypothetical protein